MVFVDAHFTTGPLGNIWLMAHFQKRVSKRQIKKTSVSKAIKELEKPSQIALRTYGQCLVGLSRIHLKQVEYLHADCNDAVSKLKIKFTKSNVNLPPGKDRSSKNAITLEENNDAEADLNLIGSMDVDTHVLNLNFDKIDINNSDAMSDYGTGINLNVNIGTGSGSHGLGMIGTSTGNNLISNENNNNNNNNNIDNQSLSSFGGNISNIDKRSNTRTNTTNASDLNAFQAKTDEITLNENDSHLGNDSPMRRISFGNGSHDGQLPMSFDDTQDVDIEIDFGDGAVAPEFDENEAQSVEAGRAVSNISNIDNNNNNISDLEGGMIGMVDQLSAIKGPKPTIDNLSTMSDVASAVPSIDNLSQHSNENGSVADGAPMMLDESIQPPNMLDSDMMVPQMNENAVNIDNTDVASVASVGSVGSVPSVSTVDLQQQQQPQQKHKKKKRGRSEDSNEENNENDGNETDSEQDDTNNNNKNKNNKNEEEHRRKRYKKSRKPRFAMETDSQGEIETDQNIGNNGEVDIDSYLLPERDVLHIWRERPITEQFNNEMDGIMNFPMCVADTMFGNGFVANFGNIGNEYETYMPREVLECYNNILNAVPVENADLSQDAAAVAAVASQREEEEQEDLLGAMFMPHFSGMDDDMNEGDSDESDIEIGRDNNDNNNDNNNENMDIMDDGNNIEPLVDENGSLMKGVSGNESYLQPQQLHLDDSRSDITGDESNQSNINVLDGNTTILDCVVNDNIGNLDATVIDENGTVVSIFPTPEIEHETTLHAINEELEDIDIEIESKHREETNDNNNNNNNNNVVGSERGKEKDSDVNNVKFRSWSKRTQKTLQYLNNKEGKAFSFDEMMQETTKKETVAGVFYELLVLKNADLIDLKQKQCFEDFTVTKTKEFDSYVNKVKIVRMSQSQ